MPTNQEQEQKQESVVQKQAKRIGRQKLMKLGKKAGKAALKAVAKGVLAAGKALIGLLAGLGAPTLLVIGGVVILIIIIFIATSLFFIDDPDSLDKEARELRTHIIEAADNTVDMTRPEQIPYRVPHELIISAMQIYDSDGKVDSKEAASQLADALRPIFEYETFTGETVTIYTTCVDGECSSHTETYTFELEFLMRVDAWDRIMTAEVFSEKTPWETASSSTTSEDGTTTTTSVSSQSDFFWSDETVVMDYTLYDQELTKEPFEYLQESKFTVEAIYEIAGGEIYYTEWLTSNSLAGFEGTIIPGTGIPSEYMEYYLEAEKKYGVDWYYLAAIHFTETGFSTHPTMISSAGAIGHMQFMPCTWVGWGYPGCVGSNGNVDIPEEIMTSPAWIQKYGGLGVDSTGSGKADPWDVKDAIFAAAKYLSQNGFSQNIGNAIFQYNHSETYVKNVQAKANEFKDASQYLPDSGSIPDLEPGSFMRPAMGVFKSPFGSRKIQGKTVVHYGVDISDPSGPPVVATADGVVSKVHTGCPKIGEYGSKCGGGWGNHVFVLHTVNGKVYEAVYAHLNTVGVSKGQQLQQGQFIGKMGTSGSSTGVHLHFELYNGPRNGYSNVLNPAHYIPL